MNPEAESVICEVCGDLVEADKYQAHYRRKHVERPLKHCPLCQKTFTCRFAASVACDPLIHEFFNFQLRLNFNIIWHITRMLECSLAMSAQNASTLLQTLPLTRIFMTKPKIQFHVRSAACFSSSEPS